VIALGVNGGLRSKRLSFVMCDLRRRDASRRTCRGCGRLAAGVCGFVVVEALAEDDVCCGERIVRYSEIII